MLSERACGFGFMVFIDNLLGAVTLQGPIFNDSLPRRCDYTAFRRFTPHHKTGARLVAQSKVNRLMNQVMTSTGTGARRTSVRLRKGRAITIISILFSKGSEVTRTVVAKERDHKVVAESQKVHRVPEKIRHPVVTRDQRHEQEL
jgi:hypothetical protein